VRLQVEARRGDLSTVGVIPRRSLQMVLRFNDVSTWTLTARRADLSSYVQQAFQEGGGVIVRDLDNPDSDPVLSGPWSGNDEEWTASDTGVITLSGVSDMIHVKDRPALPYPTGPISTEGQSGAAYDVRTGRAGDVIRAYVRANFQAIPQYAFTVGADGAEGMTVTGSARYDSLLEILQTLAVAGGDIGFRVVQRGVTLVFECYTPVTRVNVLLSRQTGTLVGGKTTRSAPTVTHVIVLQQGQAEDRSVNYFSTAASLAQSALWRRTVVDVVDRRDTPDYDTAVASALEAIAEGVATGTINAELQDTDLTRFGRDYAVGDRVKYQPWWLPLTADPLVDVVREVTVTQGDGSSYVEVKAAVGPPGTDTAPSNQYTRLRTLEAKVRRLGAQ